MTLESILGRQDVPEEVREIINRHISERDNIKTAIEVSETKYRRLFETAMDGILIVDAKTGQIDDVNPFLIKMLGYTEAEFRGKKLWEIGAFCDQTASRRLFEQLQREGYVRYEDLPLKTRDGHEVAVEFVSNTYPVNGKRVAQCNIRNISDRKQAETEKNASGEKYKSIFQNALEGIFQSTF